MAREICQMNKPALVIFSNENFLQGRLASTEAPGPAARLLHGCPVPHLLLYALATNTELHQVPRTYHHLCLPCAPCIGCPSLGLPLTYLLEKPLAQKSTPRAPLGKPSLPWWAGTAPPGPSALHGVWWPVCMLIVLLEKLLEGSYQVSQLQRLGQHGPCT